MAGWKDAPEVDAAPAWAAAPLVDAAPAQGSRARAAQQADGVLTKAVMNILPGLVRGAGSIGATILSPFDKVSDVADSVTGEGSGVPANDQRRAAMDAGLTTMGADPNDPGFKLGKTGAEIAGTSGAGGVLARGAAAVPGVAAKVPGLLNAVRTGGMAAGPAAPGAVGAAANLATRATGGAVTGGASAGLVDPSQAEAGMLISAGLPVAAKLAGAAGTGVRRVVTGPAQAPDLAKAIADARAAGFVIPPSQARPSLVNRVLEGTAGKASTAQNASVRNAEAALGLVTQDLGLPAGTKITPDVLSSLRSTAGTAYHDIKTLGTMQGDRTFNNQMAGLKGAYEGAAKDFPELANPELSRVLDSLKQPQFKASSAIDAIRLIREKADKAFSTGDKGTSRALRQAATAMEDLVERNLARMNSQSSLDSLLAGGALERGNFTGEVLNAAMQNPASQMLQSFRNARQMIAKTYSVEHALNPVTGSIDARVLAAELKRGKPLSGGMEQVAQFASRFPKAAQTVEGMGSLPQTSPLDLWGAGIASGLMGTPIAMGGALARPAARALALSPLVQNRLVAPTGPNPIAMLFANPAARQLGYRAAPVALTDR